jgi:RNA polymerase I-specific transcription initiation factor RRN3
MTGAVTGNSQSSMVPGEAPTLSVSMSSAMVSEEKINVPQDGSESTSKDAVNHPLHIPPFIETTVSVEQDDATRFVLSKCQLPPRKEFEPVETFVANAVKEQHEFKSDNVPVQSYKGILDAIRFKNDPVMLQRLLLALRTAGNGTTLQFLASSASKHARLIHNIVRLNPFLVPATTPTTTVGADQETQPSQSVVNYDLPDAYLHLMMALVSANSLFLVPTMTSLWNFLTSQVEDAHAPAEV